MTRRSAFSCSVAALVSFVCGVMVAAGPSQSAPVYRSDVHSVAVYATVRDRDGRLVDNLTRDDFQILDDGRPVPVTVFSHDVLPITVALMLDMSDSVGLDYLRIRESALRFVDVLLPGDRVRIGTFGRDVALSPLLTGDKAILRRVLNEELWISHLTALWTALKAGMDSLKAEPGRKVLLVLTDGQDACALAITAVPGAGVARLGHSFCVPLDIVRNQVDQDEFMVYAIGFQGAGLTPEMVDLSERGGGGHFEVRQGADLAQTFERVAQELHSQYALGFTQPVLDGRTHRIALKVSRPGLTAKARRSYIADAR